MTSNSHPQLIISADDFGLVPSVSAGILEGLATGCMTETNFIATSPYRMDGVKQAHKQRLSRIGIHLNLEVGFACSDQHPLPNLSLSVGTEAYYHWVEAEFFAQCAFLEKNHLTLTHLTYHKNIIIDERLTAIIIKIAKVYQVPVRRLPNENFNRQLEKAQLLLPEKKIINPANIPYSLAFLQQQLQKIEAKTVEVICHPGYASKELAEISSLVTSRPQELKLFTDPKTTCMIRKEGFQLTNYSNLWR